jgi:Na+-translocating ferredoxin:NAD+ oxidoreductase RnfA subunit
MARCWRCAIRLMASRRRTAAPTYVAVVSWVLPAVADAEVSDKIPTISDLTIANAFVVSVSVVIAYALRRHVLAQTGVLAALVLLGAVEVAELRFSDIAGAVTLETGCVYRILVWLLAVAPASLGLFGIARRLFTARRRAKEIARE